MLNKKLLFLAAPLDSIFLQGEKKKKEFFNIILSSGLLTSLILSAKYKEKAQFADGII